MTFHRQPLGQKAPKPARDYEHMASVSALPCVVCGYWPVEVHHVICGRYGQHRASDRETIPLCVAHHRIGPEAIHQNKRAWVEANGPDHDYLPIVADMLAGEWINPWRSQ